MTNLKGRCFCGHVSFQVSAEPISFVLCHCRDCQYVSGGGPACVLVVPKDSLHIESGEETIRDFSSLADSGRKVTRHFCPTCGTQMFETLEADATIRLVKSGTLDDASSLTVDATVWTASSQPWAHIDAATELFEKDLVFPFLRRAPAERS